MQDFRSGARDAGFTLIELLIVIAIILILISIALPNFLEAQTRSKIVRSKADLRTQAIALDSYFLDWRSYPKDSDSSLDMIDNVSWEFRANGFLQLTTPIPYLTDRLADPFGGEVKVEGGGAQGYRIGSGSWSYPDDSLNPNDNQLSAAVFEKVGKHDAYVTLGVGPDRARARMGYKNFPFMSVYEGGASPLPRPGISDGQPRMYVTYNPTNGTISVGDIYQFGGSWHSGRFLLNGILVGSPVSPGGPVW